MHSKIQGGLAAEGKEDPVGPLALDDIFDVFWGDWEVVDFVGENVGGLNGCDVGVNENGSNAGFFEGFESLGTYRSKETG